MAVEIILDPRRGMQEQMQEILALAGTTDQGDEGADIAGINWYPRPDKPHGGVVRVPDHIGEAHDTRMAELRAADEAATTDDDLAEEVGEEEAGPEDETGPTTPKRRRKAAGGGAAASTSEDGGGNA